MLEAEGPAAPAHSAWTTRALDALDERILICRVVDLDEVDLVVETINAAAAQALGVHSRDAAGRSLRELAPALHTPELLDACTRALRTRSQQEA